MIDFMLGGIVVLSVFIMGMEFQKIRSLLKHRIERLSDD